MDFKFLIHGIDTVEVAYYLDTRTSALNFENLAAQRNGMDRRKDKAGKRVVLGGK